MGTRTSVCMRRNSVEFFLLFLFFCFFLRILDRSVLVQKRRAVAYLSRIVIPVAEGCIPRIIFIRHRSFQPFPCPSHRNPSATTRAVSHNDENKREENTKEKKEEKNNFITLLILLILCTAIFTRLHIDVRDIHRTHVSCRVM